MKNILNDKNFLLLEEENKNDLQAQKKYKEYLENHIENVKKAYKELKKRLPDYFDALEIPEEELDAQVEKHDESKWGYDEFTAYSDHFYGNNGKEQHDESEEYKNAWKHHYLNNPHHPEYWGKENDMPLSCILEMIADWWSFGFKSGNLTEIFEFWKKDRKEKSEVMSENTIEKVNEILNALEETFKKQSNMPFEQLMESLGITKDQKNNILKEKFKSQITIDGEKIDSIIKLFNWMKDNIKYNNDDNFDKKYGVQGTQSLIQTKKGHCYETANMLIDILRKNGFDILAYYILETDGKGNCGTSHTAVILKEGSNSYYWIEVSWHDKRGIRHYNSLDSIFDDIFNSWDFEKDMIYLPFWHADYYATKDGITDYCNHFVKGKPPFREYKRKDQKNLSESVIFNTKSVIDTVLFKKAEAEIKRAEKILIVRHISPDEDAIFSAKALYMGIKEKYPEKEVILGNEKTSEYMTNKDLIIILDLAIESRICAKIIGEPHYIRFDHHPGSNIKADVSIELPEAGSTCELITLFLDSQNYKINIEMAEGLFKGIIADTGRLQYSLNQTTLAAVSILSSLGIDYKKVYNQMYVKDEVSLKGKSYILSNYKQTPNGVAYLYLNKERARKAGIDLERTGIQVHEMAEIKGCPIWVALIDRGKGIGMRIRSRIIPISGIIEKFGGGGHENAAGLKVKTKEEAREVLRALDEYLAKEKRKNPNLK